MSGKAVAEGEAAPPRIHFEYYSKDLRFAEKIFESWLCTLCGCLVDEFADLPCKHRVCLACSDCFKLTTGLFRCPFDGLIYQKKDIITRCQNVSRRKVFCKNWAFGCRFYDTLADIVYHEWSCSHFEVKCRNCEETILLLNFRLHDSETCKQLEKIVFKISKGDYRCLTEMRTQVATLKNEYEDLKLSVKGFCSDMYELIDVCRSQVSSLESELMNVTVAEERMNLKVLIPSRLSLDTLKAVLNKTCQRYGMLWCLEIVGSEAVLNVNILGKELENALWFLMAHVFSVNSDWTEVRIRVDANLLSEKFINVFKQTIKCQVHVINAQMTNEAEFQFRGPCAAVIHAVTAATVDLHLRHVKNYSAFEYLKYPKTVSTAGKTSTLVEIIDKQYSSVTEKEISSKVKETYLPVRILILSKNIPRFCQNLDLGYLHDVPKVLLQGRGYEMVLEIYVPLRNIKNSLRDALKGMKSKRTNCITVRLLFSSTQVASIIGRKGNQVKNFEEENKCCVTASWEYYQDSKEKLVIFRGKPSHIERCIASILEYLYVDIIKCIC